MTKNLSVKYFYPAGRFLLGLYFLLPGLSKIFLFEEHLEVVTLNDVPFPIFSIVTVVAIQIFFGFMLIIGKFVHTSSLTLALVTLLINFYLHDFWNMSGDPGQVHETQNFIKNLGVFAGLLVLSRKTN
ncbi:MAG: DoxX family protein [Rickettsiales bacterium]|nr:DoxX family protein [Rickettsiales bacterium]